MNKCAVAFFCLSLFFSSLSLPAWASDCTRTSIGLTPISDLGTNTYQGLQGGLYPGGSNARPAAHETGGIQQALAVRPLDPSGQPSASGKSVFLCIGLSNTTQEFSTFQPLAEAEPNKNPNMVLVDGAQGGQGIDYWTDPNAPTWTVVADRLTAAAVTAQQVQTVWLKLQYNSDALMEFPADAQRQRDDLRQIVLNAKAKYPNLRLLYLSSRIYAGYSNNGDRRGPGSYENGFAVKWLIEDQINGDSRLAYTGSNPPAPWLAWGPYIWADGLTPRSDGVFWTCADFNNDGIHPSVASGRPKVAQMLLNFFKTDSTARLWFLNSPSETVSISGRVTTTGGLGLRNAIVSLIDAQDNIRNVLTSSFGFYSFDAVLVGQQYTVRVTSKRYRFAAQSVTPNDNLSNVDFAGLE